jgi:hypothetical protein
MYGPDASSMEPRTRYPLKPYGLMFVYPFVARRIQKLLEIALSYSLSPVAE